MADKIKINRLTNANVYADGKSMLGKAEEVSLPDIKHMMAEHKALGMVGKTEFWSGIDKMEAKIKWNSFYADAMKKFADPTKAIQLQIRGNLEVYTSGGRSEQQPVVCFLTVTSKNFPLGNYKQHDNVELETNLNVIYARLEVNRESIMEVDVLSNIYKVDGVDILAEYRANIGG